MTQLRKIPPRFWNILWCIMLAGYILAGITLVPFHGDESTQIYMAHDYFYQFVQHDLALVTYSANPTSPVEQDLRLINGTVNKYTIGLIVHLSGRGIDALNNPYLWDTTYEYNLRAGHMPDDALLNVARLPSALFLAAGIGLIFAVGMAVGGRGTAYLASLYYALHPLLLLNGRRAMMEGSLIAFGLLVLLGGIYVIRYRTGWAALLLGAASGLAVASKHTNAFTVFAVFAVCGVWLFALRWHRSSAQKPPFAILLAAGIAAFAVFYALNPAWWGAPAERAAEVLRQRTALLEGQSAVFGSYATFGEQLSGFWRQAFVALPQYYEVDGWQDNIGDQISRYEASIWRGIAVGGSTLGGLLLLGLCLVGGWRLLRDNTTPVGIRALIGTWTLAMIISTALLTPLEWGRYYLPVYPALGLFAALGLSHLIAVGKRQSPTHAN